MSDSIPKSPLHAEAEHVGRWRDLKFGLMMHWGLYSVAGGVWKDEKIPGYNEQIMHRARIPWPEYESLTEGFTANEWDPDYITELAEAAGMNYVVLTAKHHDGFNLWHTRLSDFNVVDATPAGRDVTRLLADACVRRKLHLGLYYSLIDWHYPGALPMSNHNSDAVSPALEAYTAGQLRELLTGYGPLCEIWFDMGKPTLEQSQAFADLVHELQPECMVSGRIWNGQDDFMECGDNEVPEIWVEGPWESSSSIFHDTWGYRSWQEREDVEGKVREKIRELAMVVARGGNYLLNIGPRGDGSIVDFDADVLRGIGRWVKANKRAIFHSTPLPHLNLEYGYATRTPGHIHLFVTAPPTDGLLRIPGWVTSCPTARVASTTLDCAVSDGSVVITLPGHAVDPNLTVVTVAHDGDHPFIPEKAIRLSSGHSASLPAAANLAWHRIVGNDYYSLRKYVATREWLLWPSAAGTWQLVARRSSGGKVAGFVLTVGDRSVPFIFPESDRPQEQACICIACQAGQPLTVQLSAIIPHAELADQGLTLELIPATSNQG